MIPCPWSRCRCDHQRCVAGWLEANDPVVPCGDCRPELAEHLRDSVSNPNDHLDGVRRSSQIQRLARPSRQTPGPR